MQPLSSAKVQISFDANLQRITEKASEEVVVNDGIPFLQFLFFFFESYPEIQAAYPPGKLSFFVNDQTPETDTRLHNGDRLYFAGTDEDEMTRTPWGFHVTRQKEP